jgi:hypothetical protein
VINYICFNSNQQYNTAELLIEYSSMASGSDPSHLLDPTTPACFVSGSTGNDRLEFTFARVAVRPTTIVIRCGRWLPRQSPEWSFIFQGLEPRTQKWITLLERSQQFRPIPRWKGFAIDTELWFHKFRFFYTGTFNVGIPSFSIAAFEIHGDVNSEESEEDMERGIGEEMDFDPWSIAEPDFD